MQYRYLYAQILSSNIQRALNLDVIWFMKCDVNDNGNHSHLITSGYKFKYDGISF
jgi:hypothetical protein